MSINNLTHTYTTKMYSNIGPGIIRTCDRISLRLAANLPNIYLEELMISGKLLPWRPGSFNDIRIKLTLKDRGDLSNLPKNVFMSFSLRVDVNKNKRSFKKTIN